MTDFANGTNAIPASNEYLCSFHSVYIRLFFKCGSWGVIQRQKFGLQSVVLSKPSHRGTTTAGYKTQAGSNAEYCTKTTCSLLFINIRSPTAWNINAVDCSLMGIQFEELLVCSRTQDAKGQIINSHEKQWTLTKCKFYLGSRIMDAYFLRPKNVQYPRLSTMYII